ncbi:MAG: aspartyl protease family protein, partial [Gammaproteobacteria bacterium]|nr:aspartyl protease family protein [Gammaproteobacteria bacterium]
MKLVASIMFWLAVSLPVIAAAEPPASPAAPAAPSASPDPSDLLFASPTRLDHIGRIVAPVMIDGRGPFRFVVDTGANHSTISPHLARVLGLIPAQGASMLVTGITGQEQLPWVPIDLLQVGQIRIENLKMPVIETPIMAGADGILGVAGLTSERIAVDFQHNEVWISRSRGGPVWDFLDIPAELTWGGLLMVPAHVGDIAVEAVIDTGSPRTLGNVALRKALLQNMTKGGEAKIYGVTKEVSSGDMALAPDIELGPATIRSLSIIYSDIPIFKVWHLESKPAVIIGMDVLGTVDALVLDFGHPRIYMLPVEPDGVEV